MSNERNMLTKTELKEERGWTDALIKCFVPNPDEEKINYTYSSKIKLYSIERIEKVEKSEDFKVAFEKAKKRKESAQRGADNRRIATLDAINSLVPIKMPKIPEQELLQQAIDSYNSIWANRGRSNGASINDNPDFLARITVNYIRHELTNYEFDLSQQFKKTGKEEAITLIREKILNAISEAYPWLEEECIKQMYAKDSFIGVYP